MTIKITLKEETYGQNVLETDDT